MDKKALARNFSRCAAVYDEYADTQRRAALELIWELPNNGFERILEIGCGTGAYTAMLRERFKDAAIESVDIAEKMVELARKKINDGSIKFSVADAEEMEPEAEYDLVTSNAAFQWFESLQKAAASYRRALRPDGVLAFSAFGPSTFLELESILGKVRAGSGVFVASRGFLSKENLEKIVAKFFRNVSVREKLITENFASLDGLLRKIKWTGVSGTASNDHFVWSRGLLKTAEDAYMREYGRITATYQIFLCRALA